MISKKKITERISFVISKIPRINVLLYKNFVWNSISLINAVYNLVPNEYFILTNSIKEFVNDNTE